MGGIDKGIYDLFRQGKMPVQPMQIGSFSGTTYGRGVKLSSSRTAVYRVYGDDGGSVLYASGSVPDIRSTLSRLLITQNNTGGHIRAFGLMGQVKAYNAKWNTEQVSAVFGRLELVQTTGTIAFGGYGISSAGAFTVETSGTITISANHVLAGVVALSDLKGTLTQTGKSVAFLAAKYDTSNWSDGTARSKWGYGLYVPASAANCGFLIGDFSSATAGSGIPLSATYTAAARIYADDGGAKLGAGEKRAFISRFLYATADTDGTDQTMSGIVGQVKIANDLTIGGNLSGVCGYLEVVTAKTLTGGASDAIASAVWGRVDLPSGAVIGSGGLISAFGVSADLGGTHTGKASVLSVPNPSAGTWDYFAVFGSATGCTDTPAGTFSTVAYLKVSIGGITYYIPYGSVS